MAYLVRKITRSKWKNFDDPEGITELVLNKLSADAITSCLRTTKNSLSFWELSDAGNINQLNQILIALATSSKAEDINVTDIIFFEMDESELLSNGIRIERTPGDTVDDDLKILHMDLCDLNHTNISFLANFFCDILNKKNSKRFSKAEIKKLVVEHIRRKPELEQKITPKLKSKLNL